MEADLLLSDIVPMFTHLASDEQDSVRILAAENCSSLATLLPDEESTTHVVPIVCKFGEDKSWRVRYMVRPTLAGSVLFRACDVHEHMLFSPRAAAPCAVDAACRLRSSCARSEIDCYASWLPGRTAG